MKFLIQRVKEASVEVNKEIVGKIQKGYLVLIGITAKDTKEDADFLVNKLINLRVFSDENDKMNLNIKQVNGEILLVSQFTLYANTLHGNRPDFIEAMNDDFNTPVVIANLFAVCKYVNNLLKNNKIDASEKAYILNKIKTEIIECYNVIGLFKEDVYGLIDCLKNKYVNKLGLNVAEIEDAISRRAEAKMEKNYEVADNIRSELDDKGIILNDSKDGTSWDIKELYSAV